MIKKYRNLWIIGAVLLFALCSRTVQQGPQVGGPFPPLTLVSVDGKTTWDNDTFKGQTTIVQIFASWCPHCAKEVTQLVALKKQFPELKVIGIDWRDEPANVNGFLQRNGDPFDEIWVDSNDSVTNTLHVTGIPSMYVIDDKGIIRQHFVGEVQPDVRAQVLIPTVQKLLHPSP